MIHGHAIAALCTVLLAGCDDMQLTRAINLLTGQIDTLQDEQTALLTRISELRSEDDVDEQELATLRQQLSELGNRLESLGNPPYAPDLVLGPSVAYSEPEPVPEPPVAINEHQRYLTDPGYVCEAEFRTKSCTDWGEPVWLDDNMGWLPFGEVR